ncbi:MAG: alanine dehydrogenase, partial [Frankiaceae bacterium]|nr:alanine dehydrogenase [Frankiaceae bacterium]
SRPTTHGDPVYEVGATVFHCVTNMPGVVPHTSTYALTNVTLPYVERIAAHGWQEAVRQDAALAGGVNVVGGEVVCAPVAEAHGLGYRPLPEVLG